MNDETQSIKEITKLRSLFPITEQLVYLDNAAQSPLNRRVRDRLDQYLDIMLRTPHLQPSVRTPVRQLLARLLGGQPEEYALLTSTGVGIGYAAAGFPWQPGDNIVIPAAEHWNNTFPWLALRERGVDVRIVPLAADLRVDPAAIADRVDGRTRMLAVAAVRHSSGFRSDLKVLSRIAHDRGAIFVVDGIQAAGVMPLNVAEDSIDVLAAAGFKWLLGMPGTGFMYVRRGLWELLRPTLPGMFSAEDDLNELKWLPSAQRYETGSIAYALFYAWTAGLELLHDIGVPVVQARVIELTARLITGLRTLDLTIVSPVESSSERSAIVSFTAGSLAANQALESQLAARHILISVRSGCCRVSPAFFNTIDEIDCLLQALRDMGAGRGAAH